MSALSTRIEKTKPVPMNKPFNPWKQKAQKYLVQLKSLQGKVASLKGQVRSFGDIYVEVHTLRRIAEKKSPEDFALENERLRTRNAHLKEKCDYLEKLVLKNGLEPEYYRTARSMGWGQPECAESND